MIPILSGGIVFYGERERRREGVLEFGRRHLTRHSVGHGTMDRRIPCSIPRVC